VAAIAILAPSEDGARIAEAVGAGHEVSRVTSGRATQAVDALIVHAFAPDAASRLEDARQKGLPVVLASAPGPDARLARPGHSESGCVERVAIWRADAYIWRHRGALSAVNWVVRENRLRRRVGPPRLVYLGRAGEDETRGSSPAIGEAFPVPAGAPLLIGRATQDVGIRFTTSVARRHAQVEQVAGGVRITDLASGNGTYVGGKRVESAVLRLGDEVAVAGFFRLRLDGAPGG